MKVVEHLREARDELKAAHNKGEFGTRLMIGELIERLDELINRTEDLDSENE